MAAHSLPSSSTTTCSQISQNDNKHWLIQSPSENWFLYSILYNSFHKQILHPAYYSELLVIPTFYSSQHTPGDCVSTFAANLLRSRTFSMKPVDSSNTNNSQRQSTNIRTTFKRCQQSFKSRAHAYFHRRRFSNLKFVRKARETPGQSLENPIPLSEHVITPRFTMASPSYVMTSSVFQPKRQSPNAHLQVLRNLTQYNKRFSPYFSPALGNASDSWIRHRAKSYRKTRILEQEMKFAQKFVNDTNRLSREDQNEVGSLRRKYRIQIDKMESYNQQWVIDSIQTDKVLEAMKQDLEEIYEPDEKRDITEALEYLLNKEGRSLEELKPLKDAVQGSAFWPAGYDSDEETCSDTSEQETQLHKSNSTSRFYIEDEISDDDDDDDEDEHLYSFPLPKTISTTQQTATMLDETSVAEMLKPDNFNWADEEEDDDEELSFSTTQQSETAEEKFEYLVNHVYDTLRNDLEHLRFRFLRLQTFSPEWIAQQMAPVTFNPVNHKCSWLVRPMAMSKKNLNPPLTGIPTIRLTTPAGQLCELEERDYCFEGPEWAAHFEKRRVSAAETREQLRAMETFDERISRMEAEEYWEQVQARDYERDCEERRRQYAAIEAMDDEEEEAESSTEEDSAEGPFFPVALDNGEGSQLSISQTFADESPLDDTLGDVPSEKEEESVTASSQSQINTTAADYQPTEATENISRATTPDMLDEAVFDDISVSSSVSSLPENDEDDCAEDLFENNKPTPAALTFDRYEAVSKLNTLKKLIAIRVQQLTRFARQLEENEAAEYEIAHFEAKRAKKKSGYIERLQYALASLDLRARLEDSMIRHQDSTSISYTNTVPNSGPAELRIVGPLLTTILAHPWILEHAPLLIQNNKHYRSHKAKDPYQGLRSRMKTIYSLSDVRYRSSSFDYLWTRQYVKRTVEVEKDENLAALEFITMDGIWEAPYDNRIRRAETAGREAKAEELIEARFPAKAAWIAKRRVEGKFVALDMVGGSGVAAGYRRGLKIWKGMKSFLGFGGVKAVEQEDEEVRDDEVEW
ncbi:uncharacterized protein LY89DRAFT_330138 [Mollisia scopiformis]|uniref:Uncharacterized protein n=1 Tax=Mollisia scopiformis TaxID=149040 RepID=A0A132B857_MOLSC|nr:uncharacterized protein LY89DRAFT_330138 [Mollisia scopiformis]KUJ08433.1 hypothetical protein LY89DRAFT_330138 [Mollisia scopiformis]